MWKANFAPEKSQTMVISQSPSASQAVARLLHFRGKSLAFQDHMKILDVSVDRGLHADYNFNAVARQTSLCISVLLRVTTNLDCWTSSQ